MKKKVKSDVKTESLVRRYNNAFERGGGVDSSEKDKRRLKSARKRLHRRLERDYVSEQDVRYRLGITKQNFRELEPQWAEDLESLVHPFSRIRRVTHEEYLRLRKKHLGSSDTRKDEVQENGNKGRFHKLIS